MIQMTGAQIERRVEELGSWHYCWQLPSGHVTGTSAPNLFPDKMKLMIDGGAFGKPVYPEVLDLGANSGYIAKWFVDNKGSHVTAVERGPKYFPQLEFIIEVFGLESRIKPVSSTIQKYAWALDAQYDLVAFLGTLHHIPRKYHNTIFNRCYESMKDGAEIVVQTKRDENVLGRLVDAGFVAASELYWSDEQDRGAWWAKK